MQNLASHKPSLWKLYSCWLLLTSIGAVARLSQNVVLHLRNGDRISGRVLSETTNSVVIAATFSNQVPIAKELIDRREDVPAPPQPLVPATGVASELTRTNKPAPPRAATNAPPPSLMHKFLAEWRGEAQIGANLGFSTVNREAFTGHMKLTENHKFDGSPRALRNILEYDFAYGKSEDVLSDNRMEGRITTEYDLSKHFLVYNAIVAGYDEIRSIDFQYDLGPGVGYKWVILTNFVFKTEAGADYQEQFFAHHQQTSRYSLRLDEDSWWQITPKIRWDQKFELFPKLDDFSEYRFRFETNLSYLLKQNLTLSLNLIDQYDTGLPADVSKNDLQIRSLIGIKF